MADPADPERSGAGAWTELGRPPLGSSALTRSLVRDGSPWAGVRVVATTASTNADLAAAASAGTADPGTVLVAEEQTAGRGRLGRTWTSPPRAGLTFSVLVVPEAPLARWGWLPLLTGLAVVDGLEVSTGLRCGLKWPNDILAEDGRKLGGILTERVEAGGRGYAVIGVGLNVTTRATELAAPSATSLVLAGAERTDRRPILVAVLRALAARLSAWDLGRDPAQDYRGACTTLGSRVRVERLARKSFTGTALDVDATGRLVVASDLDGASVAVSAGDVMHLR